MTTHIERIADRPDLLGESPVWDGSTCRLYRVDGASRLVRCLTPATGEEREWQMPSMVGCVALGSDADHLVVGLADGLYELSLGDGGLVPLFRPEPADPRIRFNDGKIDRQGRFLCGSMGVHADPLGTLWRLDADGKGERLVEGVRISNALAFSPDGRTMYFADSLDHAIRVYDYDDTLGEPRALIDTAPLGSGPDGATVDADGFLWVCLIMAGKIARFSPDGRLDRLIDAPTDLPSSLAFGGPGMTTLYVTSIKDSGSGRAVSRHPDGGCLFAITGLGVRGLAETRFGGTAGHPTFSEST